VIIISFGFLGEAYLMRGNDGQASYAGKVFNKTISFEEFDRNYKQAQIEAMIQYGENFNRIKPLLDFQAETWDRIILLKEAQRRRIRVSDEEVVQSIQGYPFFQRDGKFDDLLYKDVLQYVLRVKAREFEEGVRDSLKHSLLYKQVTADIDIDDTELWDAYQRENEKIQVSYVLLSSEAFKDKATFDPAQAQTYYERHQQEFLKPLTINVEYLAFDYPQDATDEQKDSAFEKAVEAANLLGTDPDFEKTAQTFRTTVKTSGFFSQEDPNLTIGWPLELIQKLFQLGIGQIEGPVETHNGYHILRVKEKKRSYIPDFEEAKEQVRSAWMANEAKKLAKIKAEEYSKTFHEEFASVKRPNFAQIAKKNGLDIHQTPVFNRGQYLPVVGLAKDFQETAFSLDPDNRLSGVVETAKGYCILHLDSILPAEKEEFEKDKEEFKKEMLSERKKNAFSDFLTYLRLKADLQDNIAAMKTQPAS